MTIVATLKDGRVIARQPIPSTVVSAAGSIGVTVTFTDLKKVEYVLSVQCDTDPVQEVPFIGNKSIDGNVVGVTLTVGGATTVSGEIIVIGF